MIINKEGKLFGKISVVDIAVILIIAFLAVGIYFRFAGSTKVIETANEDITCTFIVKNIRSYSADALERGGVVFDSVAKERIGEITDVRIEDGEHQVSMADGSFKIVVPEDRYNAYVTVRFKGKVGENGYYTEKNKYLAPGVSLSISTKYIQCWSSVQSISAK